MKNPPPTSLAVFACLALFYGLTANIASIFPDSLESVADVRDLVSLHIGQTTWDNAQEMFRPLSADLSLSFRVESCESLQRGSRIVSKFSRSNLSGTVAAAMPHFSREASEYGESNSPTYLASSKRFLLFRFLLI